MERKMLRAARVFVGLAGADVECISKDGELQWVLGLPAGIHSAESLMAYMAECDTLKLKGTASVMYRGGRVVAQSFGEVAMQSGANPDFRPSAYSEAEARMRKLLKDTNQAEKRMEKRMKALECAQQMAAKPEPEPDPVIEPEPELTPDPTPEPTADA